MATDGRGRGPASRVRQLAGWGGLAWWGQTDHLRGLAPAEEGASSIRRSVSGTWGPRSRGACGHALYLWAPACWISVQSGSGDGLAASNRWLSMPTDGSKKWVRENLARREPDTRKACTGAIRLCSCFEG